MKRNSRTYVVMATVFLAAIAARAADFNDFQPGAKAMGMGNAFTALADDASALFYNPAGTANIAYPQAQTSVGRMQSPLGTMSFANMTYLLPYEPIYSATIGAGYYLGRQTNGGDKDVILFHYAQEFKLPKLFLSQPLKVGGNFKFINIDRDGPSGFGAGLDLGVLARTKGGFRGGMTIMDLTTDVGVPAPTIVLGTAYKWKKRVTLVGDFRVRSRLAEFYPGLEVSFHQGLLKARVGRGFQFDGVSQIAFGLGFNYSPLTVDIAMTLPTGGIHKRGGAYQASFNYRFGAPSFASKFIGEAATEAEALRADLVRLRGRKSKLDGETSAAQTNKNISGSELQVLEERVRQMQDTYRLLQKRVDESKYELKAAEYQRRRNAGERLSPPLKPSPRPKPRTVWPKRHKVGSGDTLRSLSRRYYGNARYWERIYQANKTKVKRGLPKIGAVLTIPRPPR